jgi:hypothetical protein
MNAGPGSVYVVYGGCPLLGPSAFSCCPLYGCRQTRPPCVCVRVRVCVCVYRCTRVGSVQLAPKCPLLCCVLCAARAKKEKTPPASTTAHGPGLVGSRLTRYRRLVVQGGGAEQVLDDAQSLPRSLVAFLCRCLDGSLYPCVDVSLCRRLLIIVARRIGPRVWCCEAIIYQS